MIKTCFASCIARSFAFTELKETMAKSYSCDIYRDVIHISRDQGEVFLFSYGVIVAWGLPTDGFLRLLEDLKPFVKGLLAQTLSDEFTFETTEAGFFHIKNDLITLGTTNVLEKLAVSHGIAQSVKLEEFETKAQQTIEENSYIARNIAQSGKSLLRRRKIARMRGNLYLVESDINLHFDLLDTPEFFWDYPEVERPYQIMAQYLDVKPRIEILNKKLEVIHELFSMLADEEYHKHSYRLEWIIIILIAVEIFMFLFHDILGIV